jgi:hypothetical protein
MLPGGIRLQDPTSETIEGAKLSGRLEICHDQAPSCNGTHPVLLGEQGFLANRRKLADDMRFGTAFALPLTTWPWRPCNVFKWNFRS